MAATEVMANIPPLQLRRDRAVITTFERYKRLDKNLPTRILVDTWKGRKRLKMQSFMHNATRLASEINLPETRLPIQRLSSFSPENTPQVPQVYLKLKDTSVSKKSKPEILKLAALETIDALPPGAVRVYTDGSANVDTGTAGYGVYIEYPGTQMTQEKWGPCDIVCNYGAEIQAIGKALEIIRLRHITQ